MPYYQLLLISSSGALVLWIKATLGSKKIHGLGDVLETLLPDNPRASLYLAIFDFCIFRRLYWGLGGGANYSDACFCRRSGLEQVGGEGLVHHE